MFVFISFVLLSHSLLLSTAPVAVLLLQSNDVWWSTVCWLPVGAAAEVGHTKSCVLKVSTFSGCLQCPHSGEGVD